MGRVWVVGSANVDRPWRVARHPLVGQTVVGDMLAPMPGGKGLNQAVAARRMGAEVALVAAVGDDADGRWLVDLAVAEGIDVAWTRWVPDRSTGTALIVVAADGANTVTVAAGANGALVPDQLPLEPGDVVVAQLEVPPEVVADAFDQAAAVGAITVFNPSPVDRGRELAAVADVVVLNELEAAELGGGAVPATAEAAGRLGGAIAAAGQHVIVTLGAAGSVLVGPDGMHPHEGLLVEAVDTTGAGDCFGGVLAAGLADGNGLGAAMARANRAAALAVTRLGTVDAMPTAADVANVGGATPS